MTAYLLFYPEHEHTVTSQFFKNNLNIILSFMPSFLSDFFLSGFPVKSRVRISLLSTRATYSVHPIFRAKSMTRVLISLVQHVPYGEVVLPLNNLQPTEYDTLSAVRNSLDIFEYSQVHDTSRNCLFRTLNPREAVTRQKLLFVLRSVQNT
jgi:hypothetical protein